MEGCLLCSPEPGWSIYGESRTSGESETEANIFQPDTTVAPGPTNVPGAYLYYNEYIAYDVAQVALRYLFRVRM